MAKASAQRGRDRPRERERFPLVCIALDRTEAARGADWNVRRPVMAQGNVTTDHDKIRRWAEERGGKPATVKATQAHGEPGVLRLDFEPRDEALEPIDWDDFFEKFDKEELAFLYQDRTEDGKISRFHKLVNRH
jgi:hypothetical protein